MMKSRKERKLEAKQNRVPFVPQYNGGGIIASEDFYGSGIERFNNKYVKFNEKVEEVVVAAEVAQITEEGKIEMIEPELVKEVPKKKKSKFKKAMKKLFNK